jgi:regulator of sigma E protease
VLSILGFIVVLIPLVVVHEFGHFFFAKLFKVRADAFSVGLGPVIYHKKFGETDFRVSAIPLGGYVKLLGEDPTTELSDEDKKRALHHQAPWKRFFIFFGGPLFNFIWATIVFMVMMAIGEPQVASVIGRVLPETPAAVAGFQPGDKILAVDGEGVTKFEDMMNKLNDKAGKLVTFKVERTPVFVAGAASAKTISTANTVEVKVTPTAEEGFSIYGEKKDVGNIDGIIPNARMTKVGISNPESAAAKAGFTTGDEIVSMNGQKIENFEQLEQVYSAYAADPKLAKAPVVFEAKADEKANPRSITLAANYSGNLGKDFGLYSSELFVDQAMKDTPAAAAGIQKGDHLTLVNNSPVRSFFELRQDIQKAGEEKGKVTIGLERAGKPISLEIIPQVTNERDPLLKKKTQYTIGVMPIPSMMEAATVIEKTSNPFTLLYKGTARMFDLSARNLISIGKMFQGQVSMKSLGGPILIGKLAGDSLSRGLIDFLKMMAVLSIGLGILNILPIPVLDGGHIVMLLIEAIRGRALTLKQVEIAQQVGLVFILLIMIVVMKNDISRLPIFN